jgi:hypothetical protein
MEEHPGPSPSKERRTWAFAINRKKPWASISSINNKKKTLDLQQQRKKTLAFPHQKEEEPRPPPSIGRKTLGIYHRKETLCICTNNGQNNLGLHCK